MGFLDIFSRFDSHELCHQSIEKILVIFCFVGFGIVKQSQFDEFRIGEIIQREKVSASLFQSGAMGFERIRINARKHAARAVAETLVEVRVEIVGDEQVFVKKVARSCVRHKFVIEAVAMRSLIVGLSDVLYGHGFRTVGGAYPVGVRQIYSNRSGGIGIPCKNSGSYDFCCYAFHFVFTETRINGGVVLEPLGVGRYYFRAVRSLVVLEIYYRFKVACHAQRIVVALDESVDEVNTGIGIIHPENGIIVEIFQIAGLVILYETFDDFFLFGILGIF